MQFKILEDSRDITTEMTMALMQAIPDPLIIFDKNRRVTICNDRAASAIGSSKEELLGTPMDDIFVDFDEALKSETSAPRLPDDSEAGNRAGEVVVSRPSTFSFVGSTIKRARENTSRELSQAR